MTEAVTPAAERPVAPLAFLDTETDGVHPGRRLWEIAIIRREPDGRETEWQAFVEIDLSTANPFGLRVGRFYDRHPLGRYLAGLEPELDYPGRTPAYTTAYDVTRSVARLTHGAHLVGAVPSFDAEVLDTLLRAHGLVPAWHYHLICAEVLAVGALAAKGLHFPPPYGSNELTEALDIEPAAEEDRHTALGDARWAMRMYDAVMGGAR
jgi:hypothetical protein